MDRLRHNTVINTLDSKGFSIFSVNDFTKLFKFTPKQAVTAKESALSTLEKQNLSGYQNWIAGFYFDVSDVAAIDPNADSSGNGLTNFQKYLLQLNPKSYDTLGLGMADSETIAAGINPLTGGKLTDDQKQIVDKYFDMEVIMNRLTLANMEKSKPVINSYASDTGYVSGTGGQVAGIGIRGSNTGVYRSFDTGVAYTGGSAQNNSLGLGQLDQVDINTDIPGRLEIPDLKINVPIIWSKTTSDFENDLRNGVVHYPGTALPGQIGTTYISGHSSNYAWAKGSYNQIFSKLGNLAVNTSFKVTVVQKNGKDAGLHYVVTGSKQFKATDQEQFKNAGKSVVTLSTCWPVGSTAKRLVVFGELTQVEKD